MGGGRKGGRMDDEKKRGEGGSGGSQGHERTKISTKLRRR